MDKLTNILPNDWKNPRIVFALIIILVIGIALVLAVWGNNSQDNVQNQVTISGRGEVSYSPDEASVKLGIQIDGASTAQDALNQMNGKISLLLEKLQSSGVEEKDITTQNYSLYPKYEYGKNGTSEIVGYNANQQVVIKVRGIDEDRNLLSNIITQAGEAGINQVLGVDFEISNINDLKQEARVEAIKDARSKASELANAAGLKKLEKVIGWYENMIIDPSNESSVYREGLGAGSASSVSASLPEGEEKIVIEMSVIYEVD